MQCVQLYNQSFLCYSCCTQKSHLTALMQSFVAFRNMARLIVYQGLYGLNQTAATDAALCPANSGASWAACMLLLLQIKHNSKLDF